MRQSCSLLFDLWRGGSGNVNGPYFCRLSLAMAWSNRIARVRVTVVHDGFGAEHSSNYGKSGSS